MAFTFLRLFLGVCCLKPLARRAILVLLPLRPAFSSSCLSDYKVAWTEEQVQKEEEASAAAMRLELLQVRHAASRRASDLTASDSKAWDLAGALKDSPRGEYLKLMGAVVQAVGLAYNTSQGPDFQQTQANASIPPASVSGVVWERLVDFDTDPFPGGVHARIFAEHNSKRAIVAFRGSCLDPREQQCRMDACFLLGIQGFGMLSPIAYGTNKTVCSKYTRSELDYVGQAEQLVRAVQASLPGYAVLLAGHSLGGMLAIVTAARQPGVLKALTFAPTPFHYSLLHVLGLTEAQISHLRSSDLIAACDPYDCGINSLYVQQARKGSETCLFVGMPEPPRCENLTEPYSETSWREELGINGSMYERTRVLANLMCKSSAHNWRRYEVVATQQSEDGSPANLPICSTTYSVLQLALSAMQQE